MPRASELFYNRRSRLNRAAMAAADDASVSSTGLGFDNSADRNLHPRRQSQSHNRYDIFACDPPRRSPHHRHHRDSNPERAPESNRPPASSSTINVEPQRNIRRPTSPVLSSSDRLPGSVLLARERLLERLRGVSLSGSSRSTRVLLRTTNNHHLFDDPWRVADTSDWGADISNRSSSSSGSLRIDSLALPANRPDRTNGKKPPGLSQDTIDSLSLEIFCGESSGKRVSKDCSICLESFMEGDKLLCLPCNHRFHSICLNPWIRTCGDCPYCRKAITETR